MIRRTKGSDIVRELCWCVVAFGHVDNGNDTWPTAGAWVIPQSLREHRCVDGLFEALTHMYNDQDVSQVRKLTETVAAVFAKGKRFPDRAELEDLKQLKSDVQVTRKVQTYFTVFPRILFVGKKVFFGGRGKV